VQTQLTQQESAVPIDLQCKFQEMKGQLESLKDSLTGREQNPPVLQCKPQQQQQHPNKPQVEIPISKSILEFAEEEDEENESVPISSFLANMLFEELVRVHKFQIWVPEVWRFVQLELESHSQ